MAEVDDGYDGYYSDRLWQLLPAVYRALDSDVPGVPGPLQELLARIGGQVAVVRRSIDRLWADQSIETCDDWVIPYIGDLLGTRLVSDDPRGQRLEVARTIHYRRRDGTLAVLEEIARDVTGWEAHVVEGFRRIGRTRHRLDPPVGPGPLDAALPKPCGPGIPADQGQALELLTHEGLRGALTQTPMGGLADLRSAHGATLADTAFDEYFHTWTYARAKVPPGGTASPSCSCSSGGSRASPSPAARPCRSPARPVGSCSIRPDATYRCSCRRSAPSPTTGSTPGRRRPNGRSRARSATRSPAPSPTPAAPPHPIHRIPTRPRSPLSRPPLQPPRESRSRSPAPARERSSSASQPRARRSRSTISTGCRPRSAPVPTTVRS